MLSKNLMSHCCMWSSSARVYESIACRSFSVIPEIKETTLNLHRTSWKEVHWQTLSKTIEGRLIGWPKKAKSSSRISILMKSRLLFGLQSGFAFSLFLGERFSFTTSCSLRLSSVVDDDDNSISFMNSLATSTHARHSSQSRRAHVISSCSRPIYIVKLLWLNLINI